MRITFANRTISDEWWRAGHKFLQTLSYPVPRKPPNQYQPYVNRAIFKRISPQWYHFHGGREAPELDWFLDETWSKPFIDKMFILRACYYKHTHTEPCKEVGMVPQGYCLWTGMENPSDSINGTDPISGNW